MNNLLTKWGESAVNRWVSSRIRPTGVNVVRECHVPHAQVVVSTQRTQRIFDRVTAFDTEQRCDFSILGGVANIGSRSCQCESVGIAIDDLQSDVDLFELSAREMS